MQIESPQAWAYRELDRASRTALVVLAVLQAALLLGLHYAVRHAVWPATDLPWLLAVYAVAIGLPTFFYVGAVELRDRANVGAGIAVLLVLAGLGWHAGWVAGNGASLEIVGERAVAGSLALFIAAFLFRAWREAGGRALPYPRLVDLSWLNALTLAFLLLFIGVFWLILFLWLGLFRVLGIELFSDLFTRPEFAYPVSGLVGGLGVILVRNRARLIATVRGMCEALIRALLPLTAFVVVIFVGVLPFTGLEPLWDTDFGTGLVTVLVLVLLFFFNAELGGDYEGRSHTAPLRWLSIAALLLLPALIGIAALGLSMRVGQHGWTANRLWALFVIAMLGAYAVGYAVLILRRRGLPHAALGRWNTVLAIALTAALVLVISPVLDFRRVAAASQVARLERGAVEPLELDAWYLLSLGRYGRQALEALRAGPVAARSPELRERIDDALAGRRSRFPPRTVPPEQIADRLPPCGPSGGRRFAEQRRIAPLHLLGR